MPYNSHFCRRSAHSRMAGKMQLGAKIIFTPLRCVQKKDVYLQR
jgi:hypothetical protein